jgi:hypothetical protein
MLAKLAQNLFSKMCAKAIESIKKVITSSEFIARHRQNENDFTRQRKLPFHILITFLVNFVRGSYQNELDNFFKILFRLDVASLVVSKAALAKARMKLKFEAFIEMNMHLVGYFEKHFNPRTWFGFRLLAIDGSTVRLPITEDITQHFGAWNCRQGAPSPIARVSQLFDVLNKITVDAFIKPKNQGERELAADHMLNIMPNDLILLDRGYPAWWLFSLILSMGANFCARVSRTKWKTVRKFYRSGLTEKIICLPMPVTSIVQCRKMGLDSIPLTLRLIRVENDGYIEILITSLIDPHSYPIEVFSDLYHHRWPVEEDYKTMKCRMELENFSGKSALSVYQDFHAKVFFKNLVAIMAFPLHTQIENLSLIRKYQYQVNFTQALAKTKGALVQMFYNTTKQIRRLIEDLQSIFQRTIEPIRPGRKSHRNHKINSRKFFLQYKPVA